jgi:hypothetical protein
MSIDPMKLITEAEKELAALVEKWSPVLDSPMLAPIDNPMLKAHCALMCENQAHYLEEATFSGDIARYEPVIIPIIRRVFPNLVAHEMVAVQPMNAPSGLAFAMRYRYEGEAGQTPTKGANLVLPRNPDTGTITEGMLQILYISSNTAITDTAVKAGQWVIQSNTAGNATYAEGKILGVFGNKVLVSIVKPAGTTKAFTMDTTLAALNLEVQHAEHAVFPDATHRDAQITLVDCFSNEAGYNYVLDGKYNATLAAWGLYDGTNTYANDAGYSGPYTTSEAEALGGVGEKFREVGITIETKAITAKSRALKASYKIEAAQDLKQVHGLDMESELATIMSYEVQQEVDRELIGVIEAEAVKNTTESYSWAYATADGRWEQEKFRTLYTKLVHAANAIAVSTRRGPGNFIVVNPKVATIIESLDVFQASPVQGSLNALGIGVSVIGTLGNRFKVVKDTFRRSDNIILGFRGPTLPDAGVVYSPYIPLQLLRTVGQDDFQPRMGFKTRYAVTTDFGTESSKDYYRSISVSLSGW